MKKLLLLGLNLISLSSFSMEKEQEPFPWQELPLDMQKLIVIPSATRINEIVSQSKNISELITEFKQFINQISTLRLVNKDLLNKFGYGNLQKITNDFLDALNKKFPGQEVRIARALNNEYAKEWLKSINPEVSYKIIRPSIKDADQASKYIVKGKLQELESWLNKGFDPNAIDSESMSLLGAAISNRSLPTIKLLIKYGANSNEYIPYYDFKALGYAKYLRDSVYGYNPKLKQEMDAIITYLELLEQ